MSPAQSLGNWYDFDFLTHLKLKKNKKKIKDSHLFILQASLGKLIMAFKNYTIYPPLQRCNKKGIFPKLLLKLKSGLFNYYVQKFFFLLFIFVNFFRAKTCIKGPFHARHPVTSSWPQLGRVRPQVWPEAIILWGFPYTHMRASFIEPNWQKG